MALFAALMLAAVLPAFAGGSRLALVIGNGNGNGNGDYASGALANPANDANDIAAKIRALGFQTDLLLNANQQAMEQAIERFTSALEGEGNVGFFYFAGHGIEYEGNNYLIPIGATINGQADLRYQAVDAGWVRDGMTEAGNGLNLIVLDACRDNPFSSDVRSSSRGLAQMHPATGVFVLYATQPGAVARDGNGRNGVFTKHLLASIDTPGMEVEQVAKRTAQAVARETGRAQMPWSEGMVLGEFAFVPSLVPKPPPDFGQLQVFNDTNKAEIWLDGQSAGCAAPGQPLDLSDLTVGEHWVMIRAKGGPLVKQVRVEPGSRSQVTLSPPPNSLAAADLEAKCQAAVIAAEKDAKRRAEEARHAEARRQLELDALRREEAIRRQAAQEIARAEDRRKQAEQDRQKAEEEATGRVADATRAVKEAWDVVVKIRNQTGGEPKHPAVPQSVTIPQINVEDSYIYETKDLEHPESSIITKRTVASVDNTILFSAINLGNKKGKKRYLHFDRQWNLIRTRNADDSGLDFSPPLKYYDFPLFPGKTWQENSTETNIKTGAIKNHIVSGTVGDWEDISVPAGKFRAIKVYLKTELLDPSTGERINGTDISWYVPEVHRSVKSITTGKNGRGNLIQLISYEIK
ncbi:caspase family protein [uncultured Thiocystis sp.]|uniref:caspase family protein n=1 Tax=uncultured Thiocystis sp. TaxID=1202134 RepID=UPI0025DF9F02|nr:caspase family protein [uncultured Thiocystis sp.]